MGPTCPDVLRVRVQMRAEDGSAFNVNILDGIDAQRHFNAAAGVWLVCRDGWEHGMRRLGRWDEAEIRGAQVERRADAAPHECAVQLVLDDFCADDAGVVVRRPGERLLITRTSSRAVAAPRPRGTYARIADLTADMAAANFYGVVADYCPPVPTRGAHKVSKLTLVDETCRGVDDGVLLNVFQCHPRVPCVGTVLRLHRVKMQPRKANAPTKYATNLKTATSIQVAPPEDPRAEELRAWAVPLLASPDALARLMRGAKYLRSLGAVDWTGASGTVDLACRADDLTRLPLSQHPASAPLCMLADGSSFQLPDGSWFRGVPLWLDADPAHFASLLDHLQAQADASGGAPLFLRLRNVRLFARAGRPNVPVALLRPGTAVAVLPDYHADVVRVRQALDAPPAPTPTSSLAAPLHPHGAAPVSPLGAVASDGRVPYRWRCVAQPVALVPSDPASMTCRTGGSAWAYRGAMVLRDAAGDMLIALLAGDEAARFWCGITASAAATDPAAGLCLDRLLRRLGTAGPLDLCLQSYTQSPTAGGGGERATLYAVFDTSLPAEWAKG